MIWSERFLRSLDEAESWYLKTMPDDPYYLEVLERRIRSCEADIVPERARRHYEERKREAEEWYERRAAGLAARRAVTADPLDELALALEEGRLRREYLERLFFALKEVARLYAVRAYEAPEVEG